MSQQTDWQMDWQKYKEIDNQTDYNHILDETDFI